MANISVKIPEPKRFNGDASKVDIWLYSLRLYFQAVGWDVTDPADSKKCASVMASLLEGPALQWHHRLSLTQAGAPDTYASLVREMKQHFGVLDAERRARDQLKTLRQKGSVSEYIKYFEGVVMYLPTATQEELVHAFVYGLKDYFRTLVQLNDPKTINDAQTYALLIDERRVHGSQPQRSAVSNQDVVPMEIGNMQRGGKKWVGKGKGKGWQGRNYGNQPGNRNSQNQYPRKNNNSSTQKSKQSSRPCRHCGGAHWDNKCPNNGNARQTPQQGAQRAFNSLAVVGQPQDASITFQAGPSSSVPQCSCKNQSHAHPNLFEGMH